MWFDWALVLYLSYGHTFCGPILSIIERKNKKVESYSNTLDKTNAKANNALITDELNPPIDIKVLDISDFFENPDIRLII